MAYMPIEQEEQDHLVPEQKKEQMYRFSLGTCIYPEYGGRGYLRQEIIARKLPKKIRHLSGFEAISSPQLRYDIIRGDSFWTMRGTRFGAPSNKAHKYNPK